MRPLNGTLAKGTKGMILRDAEWTKGLFVSRLDRNWVKLSSVLKQKVRIHEKHIQIHLGIRVSVTLTWIVYHLIQGVCLVYANCQRVFNIDALSQGSLPTWLIHHPLFCVCLLEHTIWFFLMAEWKWLHCAVRSWRFWGLCNIRLSDPWSDQVCMAGLGKPFSVNFFIPFPVLSPY